MEKFCTEIKVGIYCLFIIMSSTMGDVLERGFDSEVCASS